MPCPSWTIEPGQHTQTERGNASETEELVRAERTPF